MATLHPWSSTLSLDRTSSFSRDTTRPATDREVDDDERWEVPPYVRRHKARNERRRNRAITGTNQTSRFQGAPEPSRDVFIFRVARGTEPDVIKSFVSEKGINIRAIERTSHEESKYMSFKISAPVSQYLKLFDPDLWPQGVGVRKYVPPSRRNGNSW